MLEVKIVQRNLQLFWICSLFLRFWQFRQCDISIVRISENIYKKILFYRKCDELLNFFHLLCQEWKKKRLRYFEWNWYFFYGAQNKISISKIWSRYITAFFKAKSAEKWNLWVSHTLFYEWTWNVLLLWKS